MNKHKQITIEDAAENYAEIYRCPATNENEYCKLDIMTAFNNGYKWQQQNSYSEKEVKEAFKQGELNRYLNQNTDNEELKFTLESDLTVEEWFEQFKKK